MSDVYIQVRYLQRGKVWLGTELKLGGIRNRRGTPLKNRWHLRDLQLLFHARLRFAFVHHLLQIHSVSGSRWTRSLQCIRCYLDWSPSVLRHLQLVFDSNLSHSRCVVSRADPCQRTLPDPLPKTLTVMIAHGSLYHPARDRRQQGRGHTPAFDLWKLRASQISLPGSSSCALLCSPFLAHSLYHAPYFQPDCLFYSQR